MLNLKDRALTRERTEYEDAFVKSASYAQPFEEHVFSGGNEQEQAFVIGLHIQGGSCLFTKISTTTLLVSRNICTFHVLITQEQQLGLGYASKQKRSQGPKTNASNVRGRVYYVLVVLGTTVGPLPTI
jgi:hypothetical protein